AVTRAVVSGGAGADAPRAGGRRGGAAVARLRALAEHGGASAARAEIASLPVVAAVQHLLDGEPGDAEAVLLRALADRATGDDSRALAATGLGLLELLYRADARRALAAPGPPLAPAPPAAALAEAAAALAYAHPDGELFDVGRVHAHAVRAQELARPSDSAIVRALVTAAEANAALLAADDDLLIRSLARL